MSSRAQAVKNLRRWSKDPVAFVREVFGVEPDAWQVDVLQALPVNSRIAMKACKGPGKSCVLAWAIWWWMLTRPHAKVVCTSITAENLKDGLWSELAKWMKHAPMIEELFSYGAERIVSKEHPETWFVSARTWAKDADKTQQANTLAGVHADYVLFVLDEVSDYPPGVVAAAEGALSTGKETKILMAGNPTRTTGPLYDACTKNRKHWWVIEITGDPDDPKRSPRIDKDWARQQIEQWGRDSAYVMINVLGQFPPGQSDSIIEANLIRLAMDRDYPDHTWESAPRVMGVDVARYGDDRSILAFRQGLVAFPLKTFRELSTMELVGHISRSYQAWDPDAIFVDQTGLGAGVVDRCIELGLPIIGVEFGSRPLQRGYQNRRAEMWGLLRDWLKAGGALPNDPDLLAELSAPTYTFDSSGRLKLESKDDMKSRGMNSPDKADALALTFAAPVVAKPRGLDPGMLGLGTTGRTVHEYDPYNINPPARVYDPRRIGG